MSDDQALLLIGGPDTGKSNFVGCLWICLSEGAGTYKLESPAENIEYIESIADSLWRGAYAQRSEKGGHARDFEALVKSPADERFRIVVPDVDGELWKTASESRELPSEWAERLETSVGALLFVRVGSKEIVHALDWVTSADLMRNPVSRLFGDPEKMPTQVFLTDLLNVLERHLGKKVRSQPRVALVVSAWDILPAEVGEAPPIGYIRDEYPMVAGRIADAGRLNIKVFGVSATGGDLNLEDAKRRFQAAPNDVAYAIVEAEGEIRREQLTAPIEWALGSDL